MTAKIIDGNAVARKIRGECRERVERIVAQSGSPRGLAVILVGSDPDMPLMELAEAVVRGKIKLAAQQQRMLIELLLFLAPKLSAMAVGSMNGKDFASALERAIQRSLAGKPIKLIEAKVVEN